MISNAEIWKSYKEKALDQYQIIEQKQKEDLDKLIDYIAF